MYEGHDHEIEPFRRDGSIWLSEKLFYFMLGLVLASLAHTLILRFS